MKTSHVIALLFAGALGAAPPEKAADLFQTGKVWSIHLQFKADQWAAIEPKGGGMPMMGMRGPGAFGIGNLLAGAFMKGDGNGDKQLSAAEFSALADGWFTKWDSKKTGALGPDELRAGTASWFAGAMGPMMRGPGPGGPNGLVAPKGKRNGLSGMMGIEFENVHATMDFEGRTFSDVAVRYKGNGTYMQSRGRDKKSFKVDLNEYVKGQKLAGVTKLNLHSGVTDASMMNEVLSYRLYRDAGVVAPRTAYARVFVSVPGKFEKKYFGLYSVVEEVDANFAQANYNNKDGLFLKPATRDIFGYMGDNWEPYEQPYDPKGSPTAAQKKRVIDFARLLTNGSDEEFRAQAADFLDVAQMARYMAVTTWLSTLDSILGMGQNYYVHLNAKTNKMELLPWDLDHSFGQFMMAGTQEQREQLSIMQPWQGQIKFLERLYGLPEFKQEYLARMAEFQGKLFIPARFVEQVDTLAKALRPAVAEESADMAARFDKVVAGEPVSPAPMGFGPPPGPGGPRMGGGGFGAPVKPIKAFVGPRAQSVADQLAGRSQGIVRGMGGGPIGGGMPGRGPGMDRPLLDQFDTDKNGSLSLEEFRAGFANWFATWNVDKTGQLTEKQLTDGLSRALNPMRGG